MKRCVAFTLFCVLTPALARAQIVVTAPAAQTNLAAADDFATRAFQDAWDMNERTDFGWWLYGSDAPFTNLTNPVFSNGIFSATVSGAPGSISQASLFLLETGNPVSAPIGKIGTNYPINASAYTHLVVRMRVDNGTNDVGASALGRLLFSPTTIYDGETELGSIFLTRGWFIYDINVPALTRLAGPNVPWAGVVRSLRWMPTQRGGETLDIDWVRLVQNDPTLYRSITWTGSANADVYLDNDNNPGNGTLGRIATGVTSPYSFFTGALPGGDYYAVVVPKDGAVGASSAHSAGFFRVNDIPRLTFVTPSAEGSSDDFAVARLGNAWDFDSLNDIDLRVGIQSGDTIGPLLLENEAGTVVSPQNVYTGISSPGGPQSGGFGDPQLYMLFWDFKGKTTRIDPNRYRIFTADFGIPNLPRSLPGGSIARLLWRVAGEPVLQVSKELIFNHKAGSSVLSTINFDMKTLPLDPTSASTTGWNGQIEAFRFDPHEFSNPTQFYVKRIKLAALDRTHSQQYTFQWNYSEPTGTVSLYLDSSSARAFNPATSTLIASNQNAAAGSYTWSSLGVPDGTYQVYAVFTDGVNSNQFYAPWPIIVDNASGVLPTILLNRSTLYYGSVGNSRTSSQIVRLNFSGAGSQCWAASSSNPNVTVSPTGGTGAAFLTISAAGSFGLGATSSVVTVSSCSSTFNAASVGVVVRVLNSSLPPTGSVDSPAQGSGVSGSVPVTGWVADDIQVSRVTVCRDPVGAEPNTPNALCANQPKIYIGDGVLVDDARPDIEAAFALPFNYRGGWGYLMLSNFLPNGGTGTFNIFVYATDKEGFVTQIGAKTIIGQNNVATAPFGAIDTPNQGETICGNNYVNFGWALTQPGKTIAPDGSSITVFIDGLPVGKPGPLSARPDITFFFPGYNTNNAVGGYAFDTTAYSNGVHTIAWVVIDSGGNSAGVGSRYFTIANPCTGP
jgi:hypothetical protein